jgi:hypothetical protein
LKANVVYRISEISQVQYEPFWRYTSLAKSTLLKFRGLIESGAGVLSCSSNRIGLSVKLFYKTYPVPSRLCKEES